MTLRAELTLGVFIAKIMAAARRWGGKSPTVSRRERYTTTEDLIELVNIPALESVRQGLVPQADHPDRVPDNLTDIFC